PAVSEPLVQHSPAGQARASGPRASSAAGRGRLAPERTNPVQRLQEIRAGQGSTPVPGVQDLPEEGGRLRTAAFAVGYLAPDRGAGVRGSPRLQLRTGRLERPGSQREPPGSVQLRAGLRVL